jgi:NAD(P)H-flavin reductase
MDAAVSAAAVAADPMTPMPFRITRVIREIPGVYTWHLKPLDGKPFHYRPGQFNMVYQFGVGEIPVSISGDCRDPNTLNRVYFENRSFSSSGSR